MTQNLKLHASGQPRSTDDDLSEEDDEEEEILDEATPVGPTLAASASAAALQAKIRAQEESGPAPVPPPRMRRQKEAEKGSGASEADASRPRLVNLPSEPRAAGGATDRPLLSPTNPFHTVESAKEAGGGDGGSFPAIWTANDAGQSET